MYFLKKCDYSIIENCKVSALSYFLFGVKRTVRTFGSEVMVN